jgi:hypothetical protein
MMAQSFRNIAIMGRQRQNVHRAALALPSQAIVIQSPADASRPCGTMMRGVPCPSEQPR